LRGIVSDHLRAEIWPYLLRLVEWHEELKDHTNTWRKNYSRDLLSWQSIEAVVIRKDAEKFSKFTNQLFYFC